ncbi:hypothetical protein KUH03_10080 [Sphingobacterium sp. E70]|uniref:hypothetical protein n=1 Tax=Sphingobacterium sp. E70 TaxID=2853439 RepID=UPI00211BA5BC|nr:hypothetical protein [Sphingobacterium sp. E70]ULT27085.1 hypothetical protein KUH03_10080 [Sphingobacterium sp. E70]
MIVPFSTSLGQAPIKVACIGNSVTFGYGLAHPAQDSYPVQLQALLGQEFEVRNFGHSGLHYCVKGIDRMIKRLNTERHWLLNPMLPLSTWGSMIRIQEIGPITEIHFHRIMQH